MSTDNIQILKRIRHEYERKWCLSWEGPIKADAKRKLDALNFAIAALQENENKNCPFCGDTAHITYLQGTGAYVMKCDKCGAQGASPYSKEEAIDLWNQRVNEKEE